MKQTLRPKHEHDGHGDVDAEEFCRRPGVNRQCTGQPDARNQMTALYNGEPACAETLECRYWDEENTIWSTEGCETKVYNGTDGGSFTGCECSHLSEFVSITVPTDAYGDVQFGSIDVKSGNLTHVRA